MQRDCTDVTSALTECYINVTGRISVYYAGELKKELKGYD
jgi:hypothetical protein